MKGLMERHKIHYAWVIAACCALLSSVSFSLVIVMTANFMPYVVEELACPVSLFTLTVSITNIVSALCYPAASRLLSTKRIGRFIALGFLLQGLGYALMSTYRSIFGFYFSAVLNGVGASFNAVLAVPLLINMWFRERVGTVTGAVMAFRGIGQAVFSPLVAGVILRLGWRGGFVAVAAAALALVAPPALLLIKRPEDAGVKPYGAEGEPDGRTGKGAVGETALKTGEWGLTRRESLRTASFYVVSLVCVTFSIVSAYTSFFASYSTMELGNAPTVSALAVSASSVAVILCNLILGVINDRFGVRGGLLWGCSFMGAGLCLLLAADRSLPFLYAGVFCFGLGNGMYMTQSPLLVRTVLGSRHYGEIWSVLMSINGIISACAFPLLSLFYDCTGSYRGMFWLGLGMIAAAFAAGNAVLFFRRAADISDDMQ